MCQGYTYNLVCGHQLIHYSCRCPQACAIPEGFRKPLHDTCASCTPSFQISNLSRKYDALRSDRMAELRAAQAAGDRKAEDEVMAHIKKDAEDRMAEIKKVTDLRKKLAGGGRAVVYPQRERTNARPTGPDPDESIREEKGPPADTFTGVESDEPVPNPYQLAPLGDTPFANLPLSAYQRALYEAEWPLPSSKTYRSAIPKGQ